MNLHLIHILHINTLKLSKHFNNNLYNIDYIIINKYDYYFKFDKYKFKIIDFDKNPIYKDIFIDFNNKNNLWIIKFNRDKLYIYINTDILFNLSYFDSKLNIFNKLYFDNDKINKYNSSINNITNINDDLHIKLYEFQKYNINKILNIENNNLKIDCISNYKIKNIFYDFINYKYTNQNIIHNFFTNGYILSEKKGHGKTIIIIYLIYLTLHIKKPNLIIVPDYLFEQWKKLIYKCYDKFNILLINDDINDNEQFDKYDIILTTKFIPKCNYYRVIIDNYNDFTLDNINYDFIVFITNNYNLNILNNINCSLNNLKYKNNYIIKYFYEILTIKYNYNLYESFNFPTVINNEKIIKYFDFELDCLKCDNTLKYYPSIYFNYNILNINNIDKNTFIINNLNNINEECCICKVNINNIFINCGHMYCSNCIIFNSIHNCPLCKYPIIFKDIKFISKNLIFNPYLTYGTRIVNTIHILKQLYNYNNIIICNDNKIINIIKNIYNNNLFLCSNFKYEGLNLNNYHNIILMDEYNYDIINNIVNYITFENNIINIIYLKLY
jgi:hypothetical protein